MQTKTIPTENPFFVHDGLPLIVQQWMYCIYCGILSNYGNIGTAISILALESVLIFVIYKLFRLRNIEKHISFWLSILSVFVAMNYMVNVRPECITVILLMVQIYATEKYMMTHNLKWFAVFPVVMLLEINVHSSMWFMHFCVLIPYALPLKVKNLCHKDACLKVKSLIILVFSMMLAMLCNPYGIEVIQYLYNSLTSNTFHILHFYEMLSITVDTKYTIIWLVFIFLSAICLKNKLFRSVDIYIVAGLIIMALMALRNVMFFPIMSYYVLGAIAEHSNEIQYDKERVRIIQNFLKVHLKYDT